MSGLSICGICGEPITAPDACTGGWLGPTGEKNTGIAHDLCCAEQDYEREKSAREKAERERDEAQGNLAYYEESVVTAQKMLADAGHPCNTDGELSEGIGPLIEERDKLREELELEDARIAEACDECPHPSGRISVLLGVLAQGSALLVERERAEKANAEVVSIEAAFRDATQKLAAAEARLAAIDAECAKVLPSAEEVAKKAFDASSENRGTFRPVVACVANERTIAAAKLVAKDAEIERLRAQIPQQVDAGEKCSVGAK